MPKKDYIVYTAAPIKTNTGLFGDTIVFRDEQKKAIKEARTHFEKKADFQKFLWNAKMRFGKTLCALKLAREMSESQRNNRRVKRVLIVTHRPVVNESWKEDFNKIFGDIPTRFKYGTKFDDDATGNFFDLERHADCDEGNGYVFFASMQYLRRPNLVNDKEKEEADPDNEHLRNSILENDWDLVVIDEAHEGTRTSLGSRVIEVLKKEKTKMLHLSGTPFNLYDDFDKDEEIYTWDYVMEQTAKREWDENHPGEYNPYAVLPHMNIFTYDLGKLIRGSDFAEDGTFKFSEFFRTWEGRKEKDGADMPEGAKGRFVHEKEVKEFLDLMCTEDENSNYPFSRQVYQENFNHTLWIVPGVKEAKALKALLQEHEVFSNFEIINVAGESDDEEKADNALDKVLKAIGEKPAETATITISCGRLTTGVTVHPWTAVFYLKGSENTSAATYMQTIFRVQSTDTETYPGKMKAECFVFDFAPDRTLRVIAETAKFAALSQRERRIVDTSDKEDDIATMEKFLNFFSVISLEGGQMVEYAPEKLFEQLDRVYIDRVVRNGFNDNLIYNTDYIAQLDPAFLNSIGDIISKTTNMEKPKKASPVQMANNKLSKEQNDNAKKAKAKKRRGEELTPEERAALEAEKAAKKAEREEKEKRITILRGIALRIPLLIYGAKVDDEEIGITVDNLTERIDDSSWVEFMPRGISKEIFNELKPCFNAKMFALAGKRYRFLAREADSMHIDERVRRIADIFSYFHNPDKETVLTPWRVVNMHLSDTLGGWCFFNERFDGPNQKIVEGTEDRLFDFVDTVEPRFVDRGQVTADVFNSKSRILEINSKTGLYPLYVTYSIFRQRMKDFVDAGLIEDVNHFSIEEEQVVWDDIIKNNIYVICNTPMAARITERTLLGFRDISQCHIKEEKLVERASGDQEALVRDLKSVAFWENNKSKEQMKFDAIVGNPPYQQTNKGNGNGSDPIYHYFIDVARATSAISTLIHPARFLFNAGKTPKDWNESILSTTDFKVIDFWSNSADVFPNVDVKGGIAVTMTIKSQNFGKIGIYSPFKEVTSILSKVKSSRFSSFSDLVYPRDLYRLTETIYKENPYFEGRQSSGHRYDIGSSIFELFPEAFLNSDPKNEEYIGLYGLDGRTRVTKWIKRKYIKVPDNIDSYKVFVPKSNGSGALGEVLSTPVIGVPVIGHTLTFLSIGNFDKLSNAEACLKYIKSRFARLLLGSLKVTQDNPRDTWQNIPLQDFTENSDIDWSDSIEGIDRQLYKKYGLTKEEIDFIESMIKPME